MKFRTDDIRINGEEELATPSALISELPVPPATSQTVYNARHVIHNTLINTDQRLVAVIGPCSIHDIEAALEYADKLKGIADTYNEQLFIIMRCYFEKPRTTIGWKGFINDPHLNNSFAINTGLRMSRKLLLDINTLGLPTGTEYLDVITPQYLGDLVGWGAIGARTVESQTHRQLASGLSCPVGFKNSTNGNIQVAVDAVQSAAHSHTFLSTNKNGHGAIFSSTGNSDCHIILRGGNGQPNFSKEYRQQAVAMLKKTQLPPRLMVDFSHANSHKKHEEQLNVAKSVADDIRNGDAQEIFGIMIESNLVAGKQPIGPRETLSYGQSITDGCIGWDDTVRLVDLLAEALAARSTH